MKAGQLRHVITIQSKSTIQDPLGSTEAWLDVAKIRALIEPLQGKERMLAAQAQYPATHKVTVRFRDDIKSGMRVVYGSNIFRIVECIDLNERHRTLELTCEEVTT